MKNSFCIVISGEAGQGIQTIEEFLVRAIAKNHFVCSSKDIMSRIRGGNNTTEIRITSQQSFAYEETIDLLFLLNDHAIERLWQRIQPHTIILGEKEFLAHPQILKRGLTVYPIPFSELAKASGGKLFENTVVVGVLTAVLELNIEFLKQQLRDKFKTKGQDIVANNENALQLGYTFAHENIPSIGDDIESPILYDPSEYKVIDGTEAVGIGALAGGCNYVASYPMSPSTGVLVYLSQKGQQFDVLVEQSEDEIAALNMVLGAWYAGARGLATTSGGGLALMQEAISLSGMTETPCVIHVAQRPGPATGLPTRTEQADLSLVQYAGHGEFPRIILSPGSLEDGVLLTQRAFTLADRYQVPVFLLTDQFYTDSLGLMKKMTLPAEPESFVVKSESDYQRYCLSEDGISPRGIPGWGEGFVKVDSDEHTEEGLITESFTVRVAMNEKRLKKRESILNDYVTEEWIGNTNAKHIIISWGSTYGVIKEWLASTTLDDVTYIHLKQLLPLPERLQRELKEKTIICIENNATGQLANLLKVELNITVTHRINKYNGAPFSLEDILQKWNEVMQ